MNNSEGKMNSLITSPEKEKIIINRMKVNEGENGNVIDGRPPGQKLPVAEGLCQHCLYQLH